MYSEKYENILLMGIIQDPAPMTWDPEPKTPKIHISGFRTREPWARSDYVIPILRFSRGEKPVVVDDNFPYCVLRMITQGNVNIETQYIA